MRYVITYDVSDDRIRQCVADILEGFGRRVQYSVFECRLDPSEIETLTELLRSALVSADYGQIRAYRMCERCEAASFGLGDVDRGTEEAAIWV